MKMPREFYIPKGAQRHENAEVSAEWYTYEAVSKVYALGFSGKRSKPDFHHRYLSSDSRAESIARWLDGLRSAAQRKASRRAARQSFSHSLQVGSILRNSWGYEQTNVDYFEVVEVKSSKTVVIREIAQQREETGFLSGRCRPVPGSYIGAPMTKRVGEGNAVKIHKWGSYAHPVSVNDNAYWSAYA